MQQNLTPEIINCTTEGISQNTRYNNNMMEFCTQKNSAHITYFLDMI